VDRDLQPAAASRAALAQHIGIRLRAIYPLAPTSEEPEAWQVLLDLLAAKAG
jgi:hypothetical protein